MVMEEQRERGMGKKDKERKEEEMRQRIMIECIPWR